MAKCHSAMPTISQTKTLIVSDGCLGPRSGPWALLSIRVARASTWECRRGRRRQARPNDATTVRHSSAAPEGRAMSIPLGSDGDLSPLLERYGWRTIVVCLGLVVNESAA